MTSDSVSFFTKIHPRIQKAFGAVYESLDWGEGRTRELCGVW